MTHLLGALHLLRALETWHGAWSSGVTHRGRSERGSVTVEHVLWTIAVVTIVGVVTMSLIRLVTGQSG